MRFFPQTVRSIARWMACCLIAVLSLGLGSASARLGDHWRTVRLDPFLRFYRSDTAAHFKAGNVTLHAWAKHYQEPCPLTVTISNDSLVTGLDLLLDREKLDSTDWIAMRDIAKNFLREEVSSGDDSLINDFANEIQYPPDRQVEHPEGVPTIPAKPTDEYKAFMGGLERYSRKLSRSVLLVENLTIKGKQWLRLKFSLEAMLGPRD